MNALSAALIALGLAMAFIDAWPWSAVPVVAVWALAAHARRAANLATSRANNSATRNTTDAGQ